MSRLAAPAQGELADIDEDEEDEDADDGSAEDADPPARLIRTYRVTLQGRRAQVSFAVEKWR